VFKCAAADRRGDGNRAGARGRHFALSVLSYAQSPQGTTIYMRRGTLLSVRGLQDEGPASEFEIDPAPPCRADLLAP
jgi:hypothetical protein